MYRGKNSPEEFATDRILSLNSYGTDLFRNWKRVKMYKIHVPFTELVCRLIKLNEDRFNQYSLFSTNCSDKTISIKCAELANQSACNLSQLKELLTGFNYKDVMKACPSFTASPALWRELHNAESSQDPYFIAIIIYKIESQFSILYKLICLVFSIKDNSPLNIIYDQYQILLRSLTRIPDLFLNLN